MLREQAKIFRRVMIFTDLFVIAVSFFLAYYVRNQYEALYSIGYYLKFLPLLLVFWGAVLYFSGMYSSFRLKGRSEVFFLIWQSAYVTFFIFVGLSYIFKVAHISRIFIFLVFICASGFLTLEKIALMQSFRYLRKKGFNYRKLLIVGTDQRAKRFIKSIDENRELGLRIIGLVDKNSNKIGEEISGHKIIGSLKDIPRIHRENELDQVLFVVPVMWLSKIEEPMRYLETVGVKIDVALDYFTQKLAHVRQTEFFGVPFLSIESTPERLVPIFVKRLFDMIVSGLTLIVLLPVFFLTGLLIKMTSHGPVFFVQERGGLNGRKFCLYKFRTMNAEAESQLEELGHLNEMQGAAFKIKNDPRVTPVGKFLRKFSVDELPQFWNVFKGDMSLVGPRPPLLSEVAQYDDWQRRRLSMRPGITCLWQVSGRNKITDFNEWARLDLQYIDNWSVWLDIKILLKTGPVVIFGIGAK